MDLKHSLITPYRSSKSSSAELSEAINSMYRWYQSADVCYVYLSDCTSCPVFDGQAAKTELAHLGKKLRRLEKRLSSTSYYRISKSNPRLDYSRLKEIEEEAAMKLKDADSRILNECTRKQLDRSRWFTRGWTLVAPMSNPVRRRMASAGQSTNTSVQFTRIDCFRSITLLRSKLEAHRKEVSHHSNSQSNHRNP